MVVGKSTLAMLAQPQPHPPPTLSTPDHDTCTNDSSRLAQRTTRENNKASLHETTMTTAIPNSSQMDTDDKTLKGGINDDDLSKQMIQDWEDSISSSRETVMSHSPEVNRKKYD